MLRMSMYGPLPLLHAYIVYEKNTPHVDTTTEYTQTTLPRARNLVAWLFWRHVYVLHVAGLTRCQAFSLHLDESGAFPQLTNHHPSLVEIP